MTQTGGSRRWRWIALACVLMTLGGVGASYAAGRGDEAVPVVVAADDLDAGHVIAAGDVAVVDLAGVDGVSAVSGEDVAGLVGQTVMVPVLEGALVPEGAVEDAEAYPIVGEALVGAELGPAQHPGSLAAGMDVSIIVTPTRDSDGAGSDGPETGAGAVRSVTGQVQSVDDGEGTVRVELSVSAADADRVAHAAASGDLILVRTAGSGGQ